MNRAVFRDVERCWWSHTVAARTWWWTFNNPEAFRELMRELPFLVKARAGVVLIAHAAPYLVLCAALQPHAGESFREVLTHHAIVVGLVCLAGAASGGLLGVLAQLFGIAVVASTVGLWSLAGGSTSSFATGTAHAPTVIDGIFIGMGCGVAARTAGAFAGGLAFASGATWLGLLVRDDAGLLFGVILLAALVARGLVDGLTGALWVLSPVMIALFVALALKSKPFALCLGGAYLVVASSLFYLPWHLALLLFADRPRSFRFHPVRWDSGCLVPFWGVDRLLVAFAKEDNAGARVAIQRLILRTRYQRWFGLRAKVMLIARDCAEATRFSRVTTLADELPTGTRSFLSDVPALQTRLAELDEQERIISLSASPEIRAGRTLALKQKVIDFKRDVIRFDEPIASSFEDAADSWLGRLDVQLAGLRSTSALSAPQVFRAGDPVRRQDEAFVEREDVVAALAREIELPTGCPGIVLYGRRRVGKTTVLKNLEGFLSKDVVACYVSLQNAEAFASMSHFIGTLLEQLARGAKTQEPLTGKKPNLSNFAKALAKLDRHCSSIGCRLLICLDEYEKLDANIACGLFPVELLAVFRESIQFHRNIIWLFAGSHEITELTAAPWTSYLVSARTVEVPLFQFDEVKSLLTNPMQHSRVWTQDDPNRPRFPPTFWGDDRIRHIHEVTGGWPHLVQLVAQEAVSAVNVKKASSLTDELLDQALTESVRAGHNVFYELLNAEAQSEGEWEYLRGFASHDAQPSPDDRSVRRALVRRSLIRDVDSKNVALTAPLMGRWIMERGEDLPWHGARQSARISITGTAPSSTG